MAREARAPATGINSIFNDNGVYNPRWYTAAGNSTANRVRAEIAIRARIIVSDLAASPSHTYTEMRTRAPCFLVSVTSLF